MAAFAADELRPGDDILENRELEITGFIPISVERLTVELGLKL
jgi:hypothetical protein